MSYRLGLVAIALLSACAQAGQGQARPDGSVSVNPDAPGGGGHDAPGGSDSGGGGTDSGGGGCTPMMVDLLQNGNFEGGTTGWTETQYQSNPIITDQGIAGQTPTQKAWLGGVTGAPANDALTQDIAVPASATNVKLTGYYEVRTGETGSTVYDTGDIELLSSSGAQLEAIGHYDNAHATTAWTAFSHTFTANLAGTTVRLRMKSSNDSLNASAFYFDTLALTAMVCQ